MKEFKGTQGKWELSLSNRKRKAHISGKAWVNHTKVYIQTQDIDGSYVDSDEGMANAKLIETAPELLKSLHMMFELFNNSYPEGTTKQSACNHSRSVINKALGL